MPWLMCPPVGDGGVVQEHADAFAGRQDDAHVALQDEVRLDRALDGRFYRRVDLPGDLSELGAHVPLQRR
jgi:hypothetical protein